MHLRAALYLLSGYYFPSLLDLLRILYRESPYPSIQYAIFIIALSLPPGPLNGLAGLQHLARRPCCRG